MKRHRKRGNVEERKAALPPSNLRAGEVLPLTHKSLSVASWSSRPLEEDAPAEEVHLVVGIEEADFKLAIRFRSAEALDTLISTLEDHRRDVWGAP